MTEEQTIAALRLTISELTNQLGEDIATKNMLAVQLNMANKERDLYKKELDLCKKELDEANALLDEVTKED